MIKRKIVELKNGERRIFKIDTGQLCVPKGTAISEMIFYLTKRYKDSENEQINKKQKRKLK